MLTDTKEEQGRYRDEEDGLLAPRDGGAHGHGLCRSRGLIQQTRVAQLHAGQVCNHCLEVQQRLQPARPHDRV